MTKNNSRKQKSQWVNVDIITGFGGAFLKARRESQLRRMYYTAGLGGYTVLGSLGSTRVVDLPVYK